MKGEMENKNILIRIFRKIFFKKVKIEKDKSDMHIPSFLDDPIGGNTPVNEVVNWVVTGGVGAAVVGVLILGALFL